MILGMPSFDPWVLPGPLPPPARHRLAFLIRAVSGLRPNLLVSVNPLKTGSTRGQGRWVAHAVPLGFQSDRLETIPRSWGSQR